MSTQEYREQYIKWLKSNLATKQKAIDLLHRIGIYEDGKLSKNYK